MKVGDIIKELDILKLKIMLDEDLPSDVKRYDEWLEKLQDRSRACGFAKLFDPSEHERYQILVSLVVDLYCKKHDGNNYLKNKPEIWKMIAEITAMLLFIQEER